MNNLEIKAFIDKKKDLFWYTPKNKKETISPELLVETILNYGSMTDVKELFALMGINEVASVFAGMHERKRLNFYPEIHNYFSLLLSRYDTQILNIDQLALLPLIKQFRREFYLVGGTAIALHMGHRRSIDFDLFKATTLI